MQSTTVIYEFYFELMSINDPSHATREWSVQPRSRVLKFMEIGGYKKQQAFQSDAATRMKDPRDISKWWNTSTDMKVHINTQQVADGYIYFRIALFG